MPEIVKNFWTFVLAVGSNWITILAGCAATVFIALIEKYGLKKKLSVKAEIAALLFFLFFAAFQAWQVQNLRTHPGLLLKIIGTDVGELEESGRAGPGVVAVLADLSNVGSEPTIADNWRLRIISPEGAQLFEGLPFALLHDKPFSFTIGPTVFFYDPSDALYKKTVSPLSQGAKVTGFLVFVLPDTLKRDTILRVGTRLVVYCNDVFGNEIYGEHAITGKPASGWPYVPGINEPSMKPSK
jgi:energy-coupling factor transporter transmembrane protein EcfT